MAQRRLCRVDARCAGAEHDADPVRAVPRAGGLQSGLDLRDCGKQQTVVAAIVDSQVFGRRKFERRLGAPDDGGRAVRALGRDHARRVSGFQIAADGRHVIAERVDHAERVQIDGS
ncbi:hypothetical protein LMG18090_04340 [Ralstonia mannitolilytica]|nr:hypothetical protein LMG18090_04340 [Ralstonia mannitolilytica]